MVFNSPSPNPKKYCSPPKVSYQEALKQGLTHYWTGKPCKHGHIDYRYTKTRQCIHCQKNNQVNTTYKSVSSIDSLPVNPDFHNKRRELEYQQELKHLDDWENMNV